jgi:hypothetical protein
MTMSEDIANSITASSVAESEIVCLWLKRRAGLKQAIKNWRTRHEAWCARRYPQIDRESANRLAREEYAAMKAAEGKSVRPYERHGIHQMQNECAEEFGKRRDREYKRKSYRERVEATGGAVREYKDLSGMSDEERAVYKREQNTRNKREARKRKIEAAASLPAVQTKPHTFRV